MKVKKMDFSVDSVNLALTNLKVLTGNNHYQLQFFTFNRRINQNSAFLMNQRHRSSLSFPTQTTSYPNNPNSYERSEELNRTPKQ